MDRPEPEDIAISTALVDWEVQQEIDLQKRKM